MIDTQAIRSKILDLAMRGLLTEQLPEDGTAEELYQQILEEKQKLIKEGKIKKQKPLPEITDVEIPFDIPKNWKWVYLGELFEHNTGKALKTSDQNGQLLEYITTSNLYWDQFELKNLKSMYYKENEIDKCTVKKGDLLVCEGGDIGRSAIWTFDYEIRIQNHIHKLRKYSELIYTDFYYYLLWLYKQTDRISGIGIGLQGFSSKRVHSLIVPFVPYYEAVRVVLKVKKAFSVLDTIDKLQAQYADNLTALKSKLIDAAIQGKLTEHLPEDGTAEELYQQIQEEKQKLIKEGKIKKQKPLPEITDEEIPFDIPDSWKWVRWGELSQSIQYGYNAPAQPTGKIRMVRISDIQNNRVLWKTVPFCDIPDDEISNYLLSANDVLFARTGGTVGKSFLVKDVPYDAIYAGYLIRTRYSKILIPEYLKSFMESQLYWSQLRYGTTAVAQPNCNGKTLSKMILPLPPLAEQKRIVQKLNKLLPLCEN